MIATQIADFFDVQVKCLIIRHQLVQIMLYQSKFFLQIGPSRHCHDSQYCQMQQIAEGNFPAKPPG